MIYKLLKLIIEILWGLWLYFCKLMANRHITASYVWSTRAVIAMFNADLPDVKIFRPITDDDFQYVIYVLKDDPTKIGTTFLFVNDSLEKSIDIIEKRMGKILLRKSIGALRKDALHAYKRSSLWINK